MLTARVRSATALFFVLVFTACGGDSDDSVDAAEAVADSIDAVDPALLALLPEGTTMETLSAGRDGFVVCTVCHGLNAEGTALGPSLIDSTWVHIPADIDSIAALVRTGVPDPADFDIPMPEMGGGNFDDAGLKAVASYVYALSRQKN